jgi:hypothetical protein
MEVGSWSIRVFYHNAVAALKQPDARLVLSYDHNSVFGRVFTIMPGGHRVSEQLAKSLLRLADMRVADGGLFPDCPQSWQLRRRSP